MKFYFTPGRGLSCIFEKCTSVNSIYWTNYVYGISRAFKSVEKNTISNKSVFILKKSSLAV